MHGNASDTGRPRRAGPSPVTALVLLGLLLSWGAWPALAGKPGKWQGTFQYTEALVGSPPRVEVVRSLEEDRTGDLLFLRFGKDAPRAEDGTSWIIVTGTREGNVIEVDEYSIEPAPKRTAPSKVNDPWPWSSWPSNPAAPEASSRTRSTSSTR